MQTLVELVYTSLLAESCTGAVVPDIVRLARQHNAQRDITGILVFDGRRFCQHLEGPEPDVQRLAARIAADTRHVGFVLRHQRQIASRRYAGRSLAYGLDASGVVAELCATPGPRVADALYERLPELDVEPGAAL